jgi:hypothetical protein
MHCILNHLTVCSNRAFPNFHNLAFAAESFTANAVMAGGFNGVNSLRIFTTTIR